MFENYNKQEEAEQKALFIADVMQRFPDNPEIWKWWKTQKFQKEQGEQEYGMIYEIDLPKILKAFTEHFLNDISKKSHSSRSVGGMNCITKM